MAAPLQLIWRAAAHSSAELLHAGERPPPSKRAYALAKQFDPVRAQHEKEQLLLRLLHTRSRAQQSAELVAAAHQHVGTNRRAPPRAHTATPDARRATPAPELVAPRRRSGVALTRRNKRQV